MALLYQPVNTSEIIDPIFNSGIRTKYEKKIDSYGDTLLDKVYSVNKVKKITNNERFTFSSILINLVKDGVEEDVDFKQLQNRFEDVVFNALSLLDDYLLDNNDIEYFAISDKKFDINRIFSDMILDNISIHPSAWHRVGKILMEDLKKNLKAYGSMKLQSGKLSLIDNEVFVQNSTKINLVKKKKSNFKIMEV